MLLAVLAILAAVTVMAGASSHNSGFPRRLPVYGEVANKTVRGIHQPSIKITGVFFNHEDDASTPAQGNNSTSKVPLRFNGRVKLGVEKNITCKGVKLVLSHHGRAIM